MGRLPSAMMVNIWENMGNINIDMFVSKLMKHMENHQESAGKKEPESPQHREVREFPQPFWLQKFA